MNRPLVVAVTALAVLVSGGSATAASAANAAALRPLPNPLYGVTVDDVSNLGQIEAGSAQLSELSTTRIYFDVHQSAGYYLAAVNRLHPVSYLMGELLDSSDEQKISTPALDRRVRSYVATLGGRVDIWEIGNEVNGSWLGPYADVSAKLTRAYIDVSSQRLRSALTLYYNVGCGDGPGELTPIQFSRRYVPAQVRAGLDYVFLSYYEDDCKRIRPSAATWSAYFRRLHQIYPNARLGFGEIGMNQPATQRTLAAATSLINYYYALAIRLPYYVGGYFWWYYDEDCLPYQTKPLWPVINAALQKEAAAIGHREGVKPG